MPLVPATSNGGRRGRSKRQPPAGYTPTKTSRVTDAYTPDRVTRVNNGQAAELSWQPKSSSRRSLVDHESFCELNLYSPNGSEVVAGNARHARNTANRKMSRGPDSRRQWPTLTNHPSIHPASAPSCGHSRPTNRGRPTTSDALQRIQRDLEPSQCQAQAARHPPSPGSLQLPAVAIPATTASRRPTVTTRPAILGSSPNFFLQTSSLRITLGRSSRVSPPDNGRRNDRPSS